MKTDTMILGHDDVETFIRDAINDALKANRPRINDLGLSKPWLTKAELKEWTGWSDRTIQNLRDRRQIPFSQHGRKIVYPAKAIDQFLKEHQVNSKL